MFDRIEAWFRNIVRQEITLCRDDFQTVATRFEQETETIETKFAGDFNKFEATFEHELAALESRITERLEELVTSTLERFDQKAQLIEQTISKELDHWQTDEETRKADHALRHPKPTRR